MGGILDYTFKPFIQRQINARQSLVNQNTRDSRFLQYTSAKNSWCRMTSFVNYDSPDGKYKGDQLSRKYILEGGTLYPNPNNPSQYTLRRGVSTKPGSYGSLGDGSYGIRPMPGITSIHIKSRGALGSTKEAVVKFLCWDKGQLEELEILFHRPGYSVLLEFGWSMYLDTYYNDKDSSSANVVDQIPLSQVKMKNFIEPTINAFDTSLTPPALYAKFDFLRHKYSGNYDGMYGLIRNFSYTMLDNGGFECTTTIISAADILDSLKINSSTYPLNNGSQDNSSKSNGRLLTRFEQIFLPIIDNANAAEEADYIKNSIIGNNLSNYQKDPTKGNYDPNIDFGVYAIPFRSVPSSLLSDQRKNLGGSLHYISMGSFMAIMNLQFGIYDPRGGQNVPLVTLETPYPGYGSYGNGLCICSQDTISIDPTVCLINNPNAKFVVDGQTGFVPNVSSKNTVQVNMNPFSYNGATNVGIIGNIYLCVEYLVDKFRQLANQSDTVDTHKFIQGILDDVSYSLGSVNEFGFYVDDSVATIIDAHFVEDPSVARNKRFVMNYIGKNSVTRHFNITSKIFQSQANMVAIGAGVRSNIAAVQTSTYNLMNKGLTDRVIVQKLDIDAVNSLSSTATSGSTTVEQQDAAYRQKLAQMVLDLRTYVQSYIQKSDLSQIAAQKQAANSNLNSVIVKVNNDTNFKALIPISLELTVDGISGMVIGNVFRLNSDTLPKDYVAKNVAFRVVDLTHNIENSDWTTTIRTQCCLLDTDETVQLNSLNKGDINTAITGIMQQQQAAQALDRLKQVYIYNNIIKLIVAIFAPANASAVNTINELLYSESSFQPNSTPVTAFTFDFVQTNTFPNGEIRQTNTIRSVSFAGYPIDIVQRQANEFGGSFGFGGREYFGSNINSHAKSTVSEVSGINPLLGQTQTTSKTITGTNYILNPLASDADSARPFVRDLITGYPDYNTISDPILKQNIDKIFTDLSSGNETIQLPVMYMLNGNPLVSRYIFLNVVLASADNFTS